MTDVLLWWLALEGLGWLVLPLAASLFQTLPDRGYPLAKALGLLVTGYFFWLTCTLGVLENTQGAIVLVALVLAAGCWLPNRTWRQRALDVFRDQWRLILATEALFTLAFLALVGLRAYNPEILGTEKPMDFAFLNGILRSRQFPPLDPWMSGYAISYYYFGYLLMAMLTRLTGTLPGVAFNLAIAAVFALTAGNAASLVYNLVAGRGGRPTTAFLFGALGALFVTTLGNLEGFLEFAYAQGWGSPDFWRWLYVAPDPGGLFPPNALPTGGTPTDWWRASRVIPGAIDEFPFFSFLLADLHPHVMALPFGVLVLAIGLAVLRAPAPPGSETIAEYGTWRRLWPADLSPWVPLAVGALFFLNGWDFPVYGLLLIAAYAARVCGPAGPCGWTWLRQVAHYAAVLIALSVAFYLPFYLSPRIQPQGIAPVLGHYTSLVHLFIFFGPFLVPAVALVLDGWQQSRGSGLPGNFGSLVLIVPVILALTWTVAILVGLRVNLVPADQLPALISLTAKPLHLVVYTLLAIGALRVALRVVLKPATGDSDRFVLILIALASLLLLLCETFYIRDVFSSRMNTVFKFYYQAWVLLAVAAAYGLYAIPRRWPRWAAVSVDVIAWLLVLAALCYPIYAIPIKAGDFRGQPTLDGTAWLAGPYPADLKAIRWLNEHVTGAPTILEAVGDNYSDYGHVSGLTGLPTVMGWPGHEWQWRGEYPYQREADVKAIYGGDVATAQSLLAQYDVTYVYVGTLERRDYPAESLARFAEFMDVVYDQDGVMIYRRR